ncbi:pyruvate dehydrogenase (acetyl-transferring) E1 component subunit alpha [Candidatus Protochlamydia phocaeensis]|uniref:pyruvate dehydrogenase (acetyl-transferring) E1 component subunit alpha n=1 Tax=Candidatus Protochlamydia phocaeensis TaxID=1414722 RepID=UPI0008381B4D|nr:pyruvate dehydrogenase (acetyl-transferring) E1 component subunit alpha [Candidatus Protochlamydia phocaeensis]
MDTCASPQFFSADRAAVIKQLGSQQLIDCLRKMLLIRNFELRAEAAYQQGKIGGFFHAYVGQEAIQTAAVQALGPNNWYATSYRVHALALLLGASPNELMAELYGRATGNARGRGGSMHFFTERLLGGFGIVTGQVPIATGAAFTLKYEGNKDEVSICFMGDGAVPQGAFHESLNLASLWDLPCIYVIENNQWGMGTAVQKAVSVSHLAEDKAPGYNMKGYTFDGMDFFNCYGGFSHLFHEVLETQRPVLVEVVTQRFKGHSISDPGLYRSKDQLKEVMIRDPIQIMQATLIEEGMISEEQVKQMDKEIREIVIEAMHFADNSPWPDPQTLEEDVFAP